MTRQHFVQINADAPIVLICISWKKMAPRDGFEPSANRLTVDCSTTELPGNRSDLHHNERGYSNVIRTRQAIKRQIVPLLSDHPEHVLDQTAWSVSDCGR